MQSLLRLLLPKKVFNSLMTFYFKKVQAKKEYKLLKRERIYPKDIKSIRSNYLKNVTGKIVILTDQEGILKTFANDNDYFVVDCQQTNDTAFDVVHFDHFIYACDNADKGMPFVKKIITAGKKFFAVRVGSMTPARYLEEDIIAKNVLLDLYTDQVEEGFCKFVYGPGADFINICQMLERTKHLPGAYVEIGCYRGSSGQVAVKFMRDKKIFRKSIFVDIFDGFNYEEAQKSSDAIWLNTHATEGIDFIKKRLEKFASTENGLKVDVRKANIISDDCLDDVDEIALANVDVDIYDAVLASLQKIFPKIVRGGAIILEDVGHHPNLIGARIALDEFLHSLSKEEYILIQMESGQSILFKI